MKRFWLRTAVLAVVAAGSFAFPVNTEAVTLTPGEAVTPPPANGQFDYQLRGPYKPLDTVAIVVRDRKVDPFPGKYNICYVNTFQTQKEQAEWWKKNHSDLLAKKDGKVIEDPKWDQEYLLDTSDDTKRAALMNIIGPWIDKCAADGFNAIEPDNLDSYLRSEGVLKEEHNIKFAKLLAERAHTAKLAIAQKNASELAEIGRSQIGFDFAITEECEAWAECDKYTKEYGDQVYEIEYNDNYKDKDEKPVEPMSFYNAACTARGKAISIIYRDRLVVPRGQPGYEYQSC